MRSETESQPESTPQSPNENSNENSDANSFEGAQSLARREWLSLREAAALYGISYSTLCEWISRRRLTRSEGLYRFGRTYRLRRVQFERIVGREKPVLGAKSPGKPDGI